MHQRQQLADWFSVVQKNREDDKKRIEKGLRPRFQAEDFHANPGTVTTTPEAEKLIESRCRKYDEKGNALPSTPRGKRRRQKRQGV